MRLKYLTLRQARFYQALTFGLLVLTWSVVGFLVYELVS